MAKQDKKAVPQGAPAWKQHQQKTTGANDNHTKVGVQSHRMMKIRMNTDYRDIAKRGDVWETDEEKAAELVRLNRASYIAKKADDEELDPVRDDRANSEGINLLPNEETKNDTEQTA